MTYVPATEKLTLAVNSEEPAGGIFAHLVNLPGLPPVKLAFNGAGALDNFDAKLDFAAGAGRLGARRRCRRAAGRRTEAHARSQFPARGHGARHHPPCLRGRDDAQGRSLLQRRFDHRDPRPAPRLRQRPPRHRGRQVGGQRVGHQDPRRRDPGRDADRQARPERFDRRAGLESRQSKAHSTRATSTSSKARSTISLRLSAPSRTGRSSRSRRASPSRARAR